MVDAHGVSTVYTYYIQQEPGAPAVKTTNTAGTGTQTTVYDLKGRITSTFGVRSYPMSYVYDPTYGELKTLTTWKDFAAQTGAAVTTWNYEAATGLLTSKVDPALVAVTYTYDIASRILTRTDARNVVATFAYNNSLKDLTGLSYSDGTPAVTHSYDRLGRPDTTTTGTFARLVRTYEPSNLSLKTETTTYDSNGSGTFDAPDFTRTLTRQYDPTMITRGNGYTLTPSGFSVSEATAEYAYEPVAGRLLSTSFPVVTGSAATGPAVFTYGYEPARPHLTKTVTAASHVVTNDWESNRDVLDKKWNRYNTTVLSAYDYTVNAVGQRTEERVPNAATATWNWDYDALGQVKSADSPTAAFDQAYQYDDIGNRRKAVSGTLTLPGTDNYTANALNQYTLIGSAVPSYDPVGNLINDAGTNWPSSPRTHVWDAENRLQQVKVTATNASVGSYRYDAFHRRVSKTTGTSTTWFLYDGWNLIAEYTGTTNTLPTLNRTHYWGLDLSGSMQGAGGVGGLLLTDFKTGPKAGVYFPLYDGNGNVTSYLDFNHTPVAAYRYDAFGKLIWGAYSHVADFNIGFSTKYRDPETDFYYYGYRYYSAALGRWLNRDPIGEKGGLNLFGMVDNSPLDFIDTLGQGKYSGLRGI